MTYTSYLFILTCCTQLIRPHPIENLRTVNTLNNCKKNFFTHVDIILHTVYMYVLEVQPSWPIDAPLVQHISYTVVERYTVHHNNNMIVHINNNYLNLIETIITCFYFYF